MRLDEIREWFARDSGRYDLVVDSTDWADNGADKYIQAGQRWLDRQVEMHSQYGKFFRTLETDARVLTLTGLRSVASVYVRESDNDVTRLTYMSYDELRELYGEDFSTISSGNPLYYSILNYRQYDEAESDPPDDEGLTDTGWETSDGLLILPPPSADVVVVVEGKFSFTTLEDDADENFWSVNEPNVLVKAALRELEVFYRNTAGVNDWTSALLQDIIGIEKDYIEKMYQHIDKLEG